MQEERLGQNWAASEPAAICIFRSAPIAELWLRRDHWARLGAGVVWSAHAGTCI